MASRLSISKLSPDEVRAVLRDRGATTYQGRRFAKSITDSFDKKHGRLPLTEEIIALGLSGLIRAYPTEAYSSGLTSLDKAFLAMGYPENKVTQRARLKRNTAWMGQPPETIAQYGHGIKPPPGFWESPEADHEARRRILEYNDANGRLPITLKEFAQLGLKFFYVAQLPRISVEDTVELLNRLGFSIDPTAAMKIVKTMKAEAARAKTQGNVKPTGIPDLSTLDGTIARYAPPFSIKYVIRLWDRHGANASVYLERERAQL